MGKQINLTGQRFGRLLVLSRANNTGKERTCWNCKCNCGQEKVIRTSDLKSGKVKSCGCLRDEKLIQRNIKNRIHGHASRKNRKKTKIYNIWSGMKERCNDKNDKNYGGRGIKVCYRWLKFENFYKDVGDPPKGLSLDRPNNDGNYSPNNWRWATRKQQANNRRNNRKILYNGKEEYFQILADKHNIRRDTLAYRLDKIGMPIHEALTTPVRKHTRIK